MSDKPHRSFWRLHLSTVLGMVALASWVLVLNLYSISHGPNLYHYGWPIRLVIYREAVYEQPDSFAYETWGVWLTKWLLPSLVSWSAIILAPGVVWEWYMRRRDRKFNVISDSGRTHQRWQVHLSTALFLALAAGTLLWANMIIKTTEVALQDGSRAIWHYGGWPLAFWSQVVEWGGLVELQEVHKNPTHLAIDSVVGFGILAIVAYVCEWFIRRREARKP